MALSSADAVDLVIRGRRTSKVTTETDAPQDDSLPSAVVDDLVATAGFAPFHHMAPTARQAEAVEPWRCHVLDADACRRLRAIALEAGVGGKIPGMLAAASAMVLVTWLPEGPMRQGPKVRYQGSLVNMEHIAATGAMIQNLLLAATAREIETYWSSGGWLASDVGLQAAGAGDDEILLGAVFLFPSDLEGATVTTGKHHPRRSPSAAWARRVR
ncbi:nitroreductase family protein [Rubrivirga sp.]|uniref:nitroreductase family protein n=1 Tax=Rubrivirga sp. TaxID=1885344 RepID=UPI003C7748F7